MNGRQQRIPFRGGFTLGYAVALSVLLINVVVTFWNVRTIEKNWLGLNLTHEILVGLDELHSNVRDAETGQRGYLLTGEAPYLEPFQKSRLVLDKSLARVMTLTARDGIRRDEARGIETTTMAKLVELEETIKLRREKGLEAALSVVKTGRGKTLMDRLDDQIAEIRTDENRVRDGLKTRLETGIRNTLLTFLLASVLSLSLLFVVQYLDQKGREQVKDNARWLSTTLRSIGDAVIATDGEGRVSFMNPVAESLTGWTQEEARGKLLDEVLRITNEVTGIAVESPVSKALREGSVVGLANHTVITAKDGTARPIEDRAAPIKDNGSIQGVVIVFRDASETREAEKRIRESEERYRSLVAATTQTVWMTSPDFSSGVALRGEVPLGGLPDEAKKTGGWLDAIHPEDREQTRQAFVEAVRVKTVCQVEHRVKSRDGTYRHYLDRAVPLLDSAGNIREWIGTSNDITERRQAEETRERLYEELREKDKRKDEFLAMLAHELRNPLAAIGNAVALSSRSALQEHIGWSMEVINRQIKHLSRLIDDLLDVSRISRGKIELRRDVLDATPILDSAVETVRPLADERKHALTVSLDRGNLWVNADPTRLEQVAINLLTNAAKYTENGGHIWLRAEHQGEDVVIAVKDTGVGIPPENLPEMFELFAQADRSLARSEGGLGIGLTVVKKLVEMHGGSIVARSDGTDKGSEFTVRLPAARRPARTKSLVKGTDESPRATARILVVDDNLDTARGMARFLTLFGHDVRAAHDGLEAIEVARALKPEFVLLDIGLPGMDGYEVVEKLRQDGCCQVAVFIAISGYGQEEDRRRSRQAGFDYHLVKPIDHDALLTLLSQEEPASQT